MIKVCVNAQIYLFVLFSLLYNHLRVIVAFYLFKTITCIQKTKNKLEL